MSNLGNGESVDRLAKLFVDVGADRSRTEAAERLAQIPLQLVCGPDVAASETLQICSAAVAACGIRAFPGGVRVVGEDHVSRLRFGDPSYGRQLEAEGASIVSEFDPQLPTIVIGDSDRSSLAQCRLALRAVPRNWAAGVLAPEHGCASTFRPGPLGAVLAGALAVSEIFHAVHGLHPMAGSREVGFSLWDPKLPWNHDSASGPELALLPKRAWLLGLGHLGQASGWLLRCLPWSGPNEVSVWLQDTDVVDKENVGTSLLSLPEHVGMTKCRRVAAALEDVGLQTRIVERRFEAGQRRHSGEAECAIAGFDSPKSRQPLDDGGWSELIDAGIGAGAANFTQFVLHRLGAERHSREIFDVAPARDAERLASNVAAYREHAVHDACGALQLAEQAVGTAFVGLTSAAFSVAELLRPLHGGRVMEVVAGDLTRNPARLEVASGERGGGAFEKINALPPSEIE
jgi:hypothetical protein